ILLLDGHITYYKEDFTIKYYEHHIISFKFPSHFIHIFQPLNVGVFWPWKHYYNQA
ncbi:hypothetical protein L873DRAFT_1621598, partial [Choiromyces venosus 120613-1]